MYASFRCALDLDRNFVHLAPTTLNCGATTCTIGMDLSQSTSKLPDEHSLPYELIFTHIFSLGDEVAELQEMPPDESGSRRI